MVFKLKFLPLLLVLIMTILLAGCGSSTQNASDKSTESSQSASAQSTSAQQTEPPKPELYTIKYLVQGGTKVVKTSDETEVGKIIKDKFGIVLEYIPYTGDYREKLNLMLAAGDYPELLRIEREDLVKNYISAGVLLPLDDYLKDSPNFNERYKEQLPYWRMSSPDKKLYKWEILLPQNGSVMLQNNDVMVRTDALEKQGWPQLRSTDDYINFIKQALKDFPTTNGKKTIGMTLPLGESWGMAGILPILFEKGDTYDAAAGNAGVIWNLKTQKYEDYLTNKYVKESFQFFNKLYTNGLLDKEAFTDHLDQSTNKVNNGLPIAVWYCNWLGSGANAALTKAGHPEMQYVVLPVQSNSMVQEGQKRQLVVEISRPFDSVAITKNAKYPERLFQLVDYFASDEGQILLQSGIKERDYTIKDGKRVPTDTMVQVFKGTYTDPNYTEKEGIAYNFSSFNLFSFCQTLGKDGVAYMLANDPAIIDQISLSDRQKEAFQKLGWANSRDWWIKNGVQAPVGLVSTVSVDPASDIGKIEAKMTELRVKLSPKLVLAKSDSEFEAVYQDILKQYDQLNHQAVVDKYNELMQVNVGKLK